MEEDLVAMAARSQSIPLGERLDAINTLAVRNILMQRTRLGAFRPHRWTDDPLLWLGRFDCEISGACAVRIRDHAAGTSSLQSLEE
jgi:hypothetical protein